MEAEKIFISSKEAAALLDTSQTKIQEYCKSKYKGFPGILDGNKYKINRRMLDVWADGITMEEIEKAGVVL